MGIADAILDLVSSGTTLRENNLKEIEGGVVLESQVRPCQVYDGLSCECYWKLQADIYVPALLKSCLISNIQYSTGCSYCKQEIIDPAEGCTGHHT